LRDLHNREKWFASGESNVFRLSSDEVNGPENGDSAPILSQENRGAVPNFPMVVFLAEKIFEPWRSHF
jgi:hypothetical protein